MAQTHNPGRRRNPTPHTHCVCCPWKFQQLLLCCETLGNTEPWKSSQPVRDAEGRVVGRAAGHSSATRNQHIKTQPHITALDKAEQGFINLTDTHSSSELLIKCILPINWGGKSWSRSSFEDGFVHICLTFLLVPPSLLACQNPMDLETDFNMDPGWFSITGLELLRQWTE